jgi:carboxymethylenebutenolidase
MKGILSLVFIFTALALPAQDWARMKLEKSPRHQEWVAVTNGARAVQCFVVYPEIKDKAAVIVMIHEIFGLSDWAKEMADELAAQGYIVIAPDLLSGMGPNGGGSDTFTNQSAATKEISTLPPDQVTGDLNAAVSYAKTIPAANGEIVVAGFCWGGGESFRLATRNKDLKAAFVFYGPPPAADDMAKINCPVHGFYAMNDARITATVQETAKQMKAAGKTYDVMVYAGAGHGFMRAGEAPGATTANMKARDAALKRWMELMKKI